MVPDLFGTETAETALALGIPPERISTIAAGPNPPGGVRATGGSDAGRTPWGGSPTRSSPARSPCPSPRPFPSSGSAMRVSLQSERHAHGKVVITL